MDPTGMDQDEGGGGGGGNDNWMDADLFQQATGFNPYGWNSKSGGYSSVSLKWMGLVYQNGTYYYNSKQINGAKLFALQSLGKTVYNRNNYYTKTAVYTGRGFTDENGMKGTEIVRQEMFIHDATNLIVLQAGFGDDYGQMLNAGGVAWGGAEIGIQFIRQGNGAKTIGRALGFGTQHTAEALRGTLGAVSKVGKHLGTAGMILSILSYVNQGVDPNQTISTATHLNFWISAGLYGAAAFVGGPFIAGAALLYGTAQLGSYMITGKTVEENILGE